MTKKTKRIVIQTRVSEEEKEQIKKLAKKAHLDMSSYIRHELLSADK